MPARFSPTARAIVERVLRELFPGARQIIVPAAGGFLVGLVDAGYATTPPGREREIAALNRIAQENGKISTADDRAVIFRIEFYAGDAAVYSEHAVLRTQHNSFEGGIRVTHGTSLDAYVDAHALQAEALSIDPQGQPSCQVKPYPDLCPARVEIGPGGEQIRRPYLAVPYVQFDVLGMSLPVMRIEENDGLWTVFVSPV